MMKQLFAIFTSYSLVTSALEIFVLYFFFSFEHSHACDRQVSAVKWITAYPKVYINPASETYKGFFDFHFLYSSDCECKRGIAFIHGVRTACGCLKTSLLIAFIVDW